MVLFGSSCLITTVVVVVVVVVIIIIIIIIMCSLQCYESIVAANCNSGWPCLISVYLLFCLLLRPDMIFTVSAFMWWIIRAMLYFGSAAHYRRLRRGWYTCLRTPKHNRCQAQKNSETVTKVEPLSEGGQWEPPTCVYVQSLRRVTTQLMFWCLGYKIYYTEGQLHFVVRNVRSWRWTVTFVHFWRMGM